MGCSMANSDGFLEGNHLGTTSFSELLMSNDDADIVGLHDMGNNFHCSTGKSSKMLCFGGYQNENEVLLYGEATRATPQRSGVTCSDSSSVSSATTNNYNYNNNNNNNNKTNVTVSTLPPNQITLEEGGENGGESTKDLRSGGLCVVPTEYVLHVASTNGADYWSPAMVGNHFSPSSSV
ncbi:hypothetical protein Tsubulata_043447 [Turnera subulata]|uniref:Uncharacterized protein n=1 Tax=Turnera subulata TaxID=218843 RepID=A0A9Q0FTH8_9ROSI|nr:hypothetical protein Tsubulata_043447 [Turnera subulata]